MKSVLPFLTLFVLGATELLIDYSYLLPRSIVPYHYNITLNIQFDWPVFNGRTEIELEVLEETDLITMHAVNLTIFEVNLYYEGTKIASNPKIKYGQYELLLLRFDKYLNIRKYSLEIIYQAPVGTDPDSKGLYVKKFTGPYEYPT